MPSYNVVNIKTKILTLLMVITSSMILASERTDFKVNDDAGTALQNAPKIAVAGDKTFIITWVDKRSGANDIYIQKYDTVGFPVGNNQKINDDSNDSYQYEPAIGVDLSGMFSIVWKDFRNGSYPFDPDIFFQRFDSTITAIDSNINLTTSIPDAFKETPDIDLSEWGGGVVVWADYRNSNWDIYGQIISSDGSPVGSNFLVNDDGSSFQQHTPRVSISAQGWLVVSWYDNRLGDDDIYVQVFDTLGNALGSNTRVNTDTDGARQAFPDVTTDGAGHFTVVWVDWRNGSYPQNPDIYSRKYDTAMVPITDEININKDGSTNAQREPSIAADRLGNVAIIWADSINQSWDISGQMIDVDGVVREQNFKANAETDSAQVSPDVALDGKFRYLTWVDRRNGNYDIYASIQIYNDPSLAVSPLSLQFDMREGGAVPAAQEVVVEHVGYNSLDFSVSSDVNWLSITPDSSTTTETISVSVNTDTLSKGTYSANLTFVDYTFQDTSLVMPVRLYIYYPRMNLSDDTLTFRVFEGLPETYRQDITIENESVGSFNWSAAENSSWIDLSNYTGFEWDTISVTISPEFLSGGNYSDEIVFSSLDADGGPDTLIVELEVVNDMSYIQTVPDSIFIYTDSIIGVETKIAINNLGVGDLNWTAAATGNWFTLDTTDGHAGDTITITVDSINYGRYTSYIDILDSASFNIVSRVPFIVDYYQNSDDTLKISTTTVESQKTGSVSLSVYAVNQLKEIYIPLRFDTTYIMIDSILPGVSHPEILDLSYSIDNSTGIALVRLSVNQSDTFLTTGESHLAELFFTAKSETGQTALDSAITDDASVYVIDDSDNRYAPQVSSGVIDITVATGIDDQEISLLPDKIELSQNYPNPFNLSTTIEYSVPKRSKVSLFLYNILGQRVRRLVSQVQSAGEYSVIWNGHFDDGHEAPTGVYFYRLELNSGILVKKMLLLK